MCGICGIKGLSFKESSVYLDDMLKVLSHRGPDTEGRYAEENLSMGVKRLSIIDLVAGSQPVYSEDKSIVLVCNGEIYNFHSLKNKLVKKGHNFYTGTDIEVIVHLYEESGPACLEELEGMFAFAIWDKKKKLLFIARDRLGIKPLYYFNKNGLFGFGSELKALLTLPFVPKILNPDVADLYFSLEYVPSPLSIFRDIFKLKPGHYLIYKDSQLEINRYWDLKSLDIDRNIRISEAEDRLKYLLRNSIKTHILSDVPLGIFLSGGIDSSTLIAFARDMFPQDLNTFSMGFADKGFDESKYAGAVSRHFNTQHHSFIFTIKDLINIFPEVTAALDEPFADMSIFPTYLLCKFSRQFVKVALSGEGGDELFMGYPTYRAHRYMQLYQKIPEYIRKSIITPFVNHLPVSLEYFSLDFKLKQFLKAQSSQSPYLQHLLWMGSFTSSDKEDLFQGDFRKKSSEKLLEDYVKSLLDTKGAPSGLKGIQYLDIFSYLSEDLLVKADRASMAASLETRVPYLDYKLVEFIWSLPSQLIFQKRLLKHLMRNILPSSIITRPKKGFSLPFSKLILDKDVFILFEGLFSKDFILRQNIFNYKYIRRLLDEHIAVKKDNRKKLSTYMMFQSWYKNYFS
ncbi:MAG: asparagine synthase (glutamine-hydrolyzing) [Candidatus Omnitrophica bacterium]|nr:asparagine synthase (glutamine-hydrolyzing) [Candidatus Omnitrophota bacterium]MBU1853434.1 asparagine synthase (glutamine-hydrolyzing) [Candidatus Omnitrophota bacterium]